jgi:prepilin-type processing-associated H-X9-DG protein
MSDYPPTVPPPYPPPASRMEPDRGTTVLVLGIASIVTGCLGLILGPIALILGGQDLRKMDRGAMNTSGRGSVVAGRICGIIGLCLSFFWFFIMAAILFPVFFGARSKAMEASCLANQKQLGTAMLMFAADHNDVLPDKNNWPSQLLPYTNNPKLTKCPADKSPAAVSYAMNAALSGKKMSALPNPATTILLYETAQPGISPSGDPATAPLPNRHNKGNIFLYADGHAAFVKAGQNPTAQPAPSNWP